jgi:hypothetical protein
MKKIQIIAFALIVLIAATATSCKKDKDDPKNFAISTFADSTGSFSYQVTYDQTGKAVKYFSTTSADGYDFYYSDNRLIYRTYTNAGTIEGTDSFFYDGSNRISRVVNYNALGGKVKTTLFTFNGDNTHNSATVDYTDPLMSDELFDFVYAGGQLKERRKLVLDAGTYKLKYKLEYLGYDDKTNPFTNLYRNVLVDAIEAFVYFSAYPNNVTSAKLTNYDLLTGLVSGVNSATISHIYNSDGLPIKLYVTEGGTSGVYQIQYTEL